MFTEIQIFSAKNLKDLVAHIKCHQSIHGLEIKSVQVLPVSDFYQAIVVFEKKPSFCVGSISESQRMDIQAAFEKDLEAKTTIVGIR